MALLEQHIQGTVWESVRGMDSVTKCGHSRGLLFLYWDGKQCYIWPGLNQKGCLALVQNKLEKADWRLVSD